MSTSLLLPAQEALRVVFRQRSGPGSDVYQSLRNPSSLCSHQDRLILVDAHPRRHPVGRVPARHANRDTLPAAAPRPGDPVRSRRFAPSTRTDAWCLAPSLSLTASHSRVGMGNAFLPGLVPAKCIPTPLEPGPSSHIGEHSCAARRSEQRSPHMMAETRRAHA